MIVRYAKKQNDDQPNTIKITQTHPLRILLLLEKSQDLLWKLNRRTKRGVYMRMHNIRYLTVISDRKEDTHSPPPTPRAPPSPPGGDPRPPFSIGDEFPMPIRISFHEIRTRRRQYQYQYHEDRAYLPAAPPNPEALFAPPPNPVMIETI